MFSSIMIFILAGLAEIGGGYLILSGNGLKLAAVLLMESQVSCC